MITAVILEERLERVVPVIDNENGEGFFPARMEAAIHRDLRRDGRRNIFGVTRHIKHFLSRLL